MKKKIIINYIKAKFYSIENILVDKIILWDILI